MQKTQDVKSTDQREKVDTFSYLKINKPCPSIEGVNKMERQTTERGACSTSVTSVRTGLGQVQAELLKVSEERAGGLVANSAADAVRDAAGATLLLDPRGDAGRRLPHVACCWRVLSTCADSSGCWISSGRPPFLPLALQGGSCSFPEEGAGFWLEKYNRDKDSFIKVIFKNKSKY